MRSQEPEGERIGLMGGFSIRTPHPIASRRVHYWGRGGKYASKANTCKIASFVQHPELCLLGVLGMGWSSGIHILFGSKDTQTIILLVRTAHSVSSISV